MPIASSTCRSGLVLCEDNPEHKLGPESNLNGTFLETELNREKECAQPPGVSCASRQRVFKPYLALRAAQLRPPIPAPTTITSTSSSARASADALRDDRLKGGDKTRVKASAWRFSQLATKATAATMLKGVMLSCVGLLLPSLQYQVLRR